MEEWCQKEKDRILSKVSEYDIIRAFWPAGKELKLNTGISSPFRKDPCSSFIIGTKYGPITYKDMGDYNYRGDVWKFVQQIEGLRTFGQVIRKIDEWFNIGPDAVTPRVITWEQPKLEVKPPPIIQVTTRKFNKEEMKWWNLYHQSADDLKREHVYAPKEIYRNRKKIQLVEHTYCYWCPDIQKWKLYRPLVPKRTKDTPAYMWKWDNSIGSLTYVENLSNMKGPVGICTKSRKDRMVLRKTTGIEAICSVQAEDPSAVTDEVLYQIWSNCRHKFIIADTDKKGKEFSWWMCTEHGYQHYNTPDNLLEEGINDVADYARYYGIETLRNHLKEKMVI